MKTAQQKVIKRWGLTDDISGNGLIHDDGTVTGTRGGTHCIVCIKSGTTLRKYIASGGCRVKSHRSVLVFESGTKLTSEQKAVAKRIIRKGNFENVIFATGRTFEQIEDFQRVTVNKCRAFLR